MLTLPDTPCALVLRTDFTDEGAWDAVRAASVAPSVDGFAASLSFVSDSAFADLSPEQVAALPRLTYRSFLFLVDNVTVTDSETSLVALDLLHEPGRWFRVVPAQMWSIENNLSIANMDIFEFAEAVDPAGVFRGFST
ncbi:DUF6924 domain-containing protein [Micromonospora zamorensis]|uniref:DUF6924 domain-containing protein n=1 Tax=Micromonospora zamorensis TaxID=709883 RepID=UPI00081F9A00|nr:hypothetical protein [Micromonospora zamorensis]SCG45587.1 hypothetical protein GA0070619_1708 [Micromonospora zamorensis]